MPRPHPLTTFRGRTLVGSLPRALSLVLLVAGCAVDGPDPTEPSSVSPDASVRAGVDDATTIVVQDASELEAAMSPEHAGRRIFVRAGSYAVSRPLVVPDGATLEGEGVMRLDDAGLPTGFAAGTGTTLRMTGRAPGDVLTLGDGASVRRLAIEDLPGRAGNAIGVVSRRTGDRVAATIAETEIVNPNGHAVSPLGPTGCGVAVLTLNPNLGGDPPPHAGATVGLRVTRTLIHSPAIGIGCGVFAFNFAPSGEVSVTLAENVVGGGLIAAGGVSRPDLVHDSRTVVSSRRNLYRDDTPDACAARRVGWNLQGGAGVPAPMPMPNPGATRNELRVHSVGDRLEGFVTGVLATGGRRFFGAPTALPVSDNSVELHLLGTLIVTPACGGADLRLAGALVGNAGIEPGSGNTVRAVIVGVTGSGQRANAFASVLGPAGPQPASLAGTGNRLTIAGSTRAFARTNDAIAPAPGAALFNGGAP